MKNVTNFLFMQSSTLTTIETINHEAKPLEAVPGFSLVFQYLSFSKFLVN